MRLCRATRAVRYHAALILHTGSRFPFWVSCWETQSHWSIVHQLEPSSQGVQLWAGHAATSLPMSGRGHETPGWARGHSWLLFATPCMRASRELKAEAGPAAETRSDGPAAIGCPSRFASAAVTRKKPLHAWCRPTIFCLFATNPLSRIPADLHLLPCKQRRSLVLPNYPAENCLFQPCAWEASSWFTGDGWAK